MENFIAQLFIKTFWQKIEKLFVLDVGLTFYMFLI